MMGSQSSRPDTEERPAEPVTEAKATRERLSAAEQEEEPDEWDKRIFSTGCADENARMTDCYFEKKDWRACVKEMEDFKQCWKQHGNEERTQSRDA